MQFGKFHGWACIALGALLIVVQTALFFGLKQETNSVPGIVGGLLVMFGAGLYVASRKKPQE